MMSFVVEKKHDGKISKVLTLDGKIIIKTSPTENPCHLYYEEDVKEL